MVWELATAVAISLILAAASVILSELLRPKPDFENARPKGIDDFKFPTAQEDRVIPLVFGTVKVSGPNVVWYGDFQQRKITETIKTGLWSKKKLTTGFRYYFGFQMALCRGPWEGIRRIFIGESEVFKDATYTLDGIVTIDERALFGGDKQGNGGVQGELELFEGTETQTIDPYLDAQGTPTLVPAYRGTSYVVWRGPSSTGPTALFRNGYIGNSTGLKPWSFEVGRFPNQLGIGGGRERVNTLDSNPMADVYELLTNDEWGFGFASSTIDTAGFLVAADTLFTEGNGFSFLLDRPIEALAFLSEIERQMDASVFFNRTTGLWSVILTRGGYDIDTIPQVNALVGSGNVEEVSDFTRGTWDETVNQVRVKFSDRNRDYENTFSMSPDLGNHRIQNGEVVSVQLNYPGVKDAALAAQISARELKGLSVPLAKANVVTDRTFFDIIPGEPVAFTDPVLGLVKFPMRVVGVDFGDLDRGRIKLTLIQDVFEKATQIVAPPFDPLWTPPTQDVTAFPALQQVAFEAPYALVRRDPDDPDLLDRIWGSGREQTGLEQFFSMHQRVISTPPYVNVGDIDGFMFIGTLAGTLPQRSENPFLFGVSIGDTLIIDPGPSTQGEILSALSSTSRADVGGSLTNLLLIDDEFMLPYDIFDGGTDVQCRDYLRGVLDTNLQEHTAGAPVYIVSFGGGLSDTPHPFNVPSGGGTIEVQLRSESRTDVITEGEATAISIAVDHRDRRPYVPHAQYQNGERQRITHPTAANPGQVDMDINRPGGASALRDLGVNVAYIRRDWRTFDESIGIGDGPFPGVEGSDVAASITDAEDFSPVAFPTTDVTEYRILVTSPPGGTNIYTSPWNAGEGELFVRRTRLLDGDAGIALPVEFRFSIETRHQVSPAAETSRFDLEWDAYVKSSSLANDFALGNLISAEISSVYNVTQPGTMNATVEEVMSNDIEARVNGGAFVTLISAGNTTGTLAGLIASDTVEVRHSDSPVTGSPLLLVLNFPSVSSNGWAVLTS